MTNQALVAKVWSAFLATLVPLFVFSVAVCLDAWTFRRLGPDVLNAFGNLGALAFMGFMVSAVVQGVVERRFGKGSGADLWADMLVMMFGFAWLVPAFGAVCALGLAGPVNWLRSLF